LWDRALHSGVTTLNYDYQVWSSKKAFEEMPKIKLEAEMFDLARHIISTKKGTFDPATFDDRYEAALTELVKAKVSGKALPRRKAVEVSKPNDLLEALRQSAVMSKGGEAKPKRAEANANRTTARIPAARGAAKVRHRPRHAERLVDHA
jgi:DNA end-binding protein Ku